MLLKTLIFSAIYLWTFGICKRIPPVPEIPACEYEDGIELNLQRSGIQSVHSPLVSSPEVTCINLQDNKIEEIEEGAFESVTNLRYLNLMGNRLAFKSFLTTFEHPKIETLVLDNAFWRFTYPPERCNDYYDCRKISIDAVISMNLPNLKNLYLRNNSISSISVSSWSEFMPNMTHLYLNDNGIKSVDFLKHVPSTLTHVFLSNNQINRFSSRSFHTIEELVVDHNNISNLCGSDNYCATGMTLKNAVNLKKLSLSYVGLEIIDPDAMEDLMSILELNLSHNKIHNIARHTFDNSTNLKVLKLHNNQLISVPEVCALKNLEFLSIDHNEIHHVGDRFSCGLPKLKSLSLSHNQLKHISPGAFDKLPSLEEIDLSGNELETLFDNWMPAQNSLRRVYLNDNDFNSIENMSLNNITQLESVNITGNPLRSFLIKSLMKLPENTVIDLVQVHIKSKGNKCGCDCEEYERRFGRI